MKRTFWNIGWRYLLRHPWQSVLMVLGVTLGVAVVVAIDLANASASKAFDLSTDAVAGRATHQIVGGPRGLDENLYTRLRRMGGEREIAPIVSSYVTSQQLGNQPLQLLGVDPFAEAPFRDYLSNEEGLPVESLTEFLTKPGTILVSNQLAKEYNLTQGSTVNLDIGGFARKATIVGLLAPNDRLSQRALSGMILTDISTAQEFTNRIGKLDRIDLILSSNKRSQSANIQDLLPDGARLEAIETRSGTVQQMTAAFRINLTALSLLALVVGMFLIYNTMTFSVVQRRPLFGTLRSIGVTRQEIFTLVLFEALIVGILSSFFGLLLGVLMGQGAIQLVTQTINDLFFVVTVRGIEIPASSLIKGASLGILATLITAAPPAWEAASVPPRAALSQSGLESKARQAVNLAARGGILLLVVGITSLVFPSRNLVTSFLGTFAVIVSFAMLTPLATRWLMRGFSPITGRVWGALGRMAPRDVEKSISRTSIAVASLMVAVSVIIGVSLMISSFRFTVSAWLSQSLQGDIYISPPGLTATQNDFTIDPGVLAQLSKSSQIARIDKLRSVMVGSPSGEVHIAAVDNPDTGQERSYKYTDIDSQDIWPAIRNGGVIVSEPFANRLGISPQNNKLTLFTAQGSQQFPVVGVYYDYTSTQGTVIMSLDTYQKLWEDELITAVSLRLNPGVNVDEFANETRRMITPIQGLLVQPNKVLRQEALEVFDRTFAITGALQLLATAVAFIGVLSALLALQLEKQHELGILRAVGLTIRQLWGLIMLETGLMGAVAGLVALPTGYVLSLILIHIINRRSFGWTLQMNIVPEPFIEAFVIAIAAALLAGIYPAYKIGRMITADAIRYE